MIQNNSLNFDLINSVNKNCSSLIYIFAEKNKLKNELNYLSNGLFEKLPSEESSSQIVVSKMFERPFLLYVAHQASFNEGKFLETFHGFYISNPNVPKQSLWVLEGYSSPRNKIKADLNIEIKTIGN